MIKGRKKKENMNNKEKKRKERKGKGKRKKKTEKTAQKQIRAFFDFGGFNFRDFRFNAALSYFPPL